MTANPLEDHSLDGYRLFPVELTKLTRAALKDLGLDNKSVDRCKNFFALGMCYWLYNRSMENYAALDRSEIQKQAAARAGEPHGHAGRIQLLRGHRSVSDQLRDSAGEALARRVSQHQRQYRAGDGVCGRFAEGGAPAVSRFVSDHARLRYFARAFELQRFRRDHVSGGRRNRRGYFGDWRGVCGAPSASLPLPVPAWR